MNVEGLIGKITSNIDDVGKLVGFAYGLQANAVRDGLSFMDQLNYLISQAMTDPHFPDLGHVVSNLTVGGASEPLKNTIKIALLGEVMDYLGFGGKWASILKKGGWNAALGVGLFSLVGHATMWHSPGPSKGSNGGNPNESNSPQNLNVNVGAY
jgi:hypothetical protein